MTTQDTISPRIGLTDIWRSAGGIRLKLIKTVDLLVGGAVAFVMPSSSGSPGPRDVRRILVIRPGGIGDAVFLLSIIEALKEQHGVEIDILCERRNEGVFLLAGHLCRRIWCYDRWPELWCVLREKYDVVIDTEQWHYLSALVARWSRSPLRAGFATRPLRAKLFHVKVAYDLDAPELRNFIALFQTIFAMGDIGVVPGFLQARHLSHKVRVALFWGGSIPERRLAAGQVGSMARSLVDSGCTVALFGGEDIREEAKEIAKGFSQPDAVRNYAGRASLADTVEYLRECDAFIGTDSGLLHLASACGSPVAGIFGPGNEKKWGPVGARDLVVKIHRAPSDRTVFGYTFVTSPGQRLSLDPGQEAAVLAWVRKVTGPV